MLQHCNALDTQSCNLSIMLQLAGPAMDLATRLLIVDDDPGIRELTAAAGGMKN